MNLDQAGQDRMLSTHGFWTSAGRLRDGIFGTLPFHMSVVDADCGLRPWLGLLARHLHMPGLPHYVVPEFSGQDKESESGCCNNVLNLALEVTECHFCCILLIRSESLGQAHI